MIHKRLIFAIILSLAPLACSKENKGASESHSNAPDVSRLEHPDLLKNITFRGSDQNSGWVLELCSNGTALSYNEYPQEFEQETKKTSTGYVCGNLKKGKWGVSADKNIVFVPELECDNAAEDQGECLIGTCRPPKSAAPEERSLDKHWEQLKEKGESSYSQSYYMEGISPGTRLCGNAP